MTLQTHKNKETKRINWMDNLRSVIILLVVVYHVGGVYESTGMWGYFWIVDDPDTLPWVGIAGIIFDIILMPTMFFISGFLTPSSLLSKTPSGFVLSKIKRLILPWMIAVLTLIPLYQFIFLYSRSLPQGNWFDYLYFNSPFSQNWLWFLPLLFAFNIIYLLIEKIGIKTHRISMPMMVILSLILSIGFSFLIGNLSGFRSWTKTPVLDFENERLLAHFLFYMAGVVAYKKNMFTASPKGKALYLTVNSIAWLPITAHIFLRIWPYITGDFSVTPLYRILWFTSFHISSLLMIYLMVESFRKYLDRTGTIWNFLNRNSFGVYIIHVIAIGVFGTILLNMNQHAAVKWILLIISAYVGSNLIVVFFIYLRKIAAGLKLSESNGAIN